MSDERLRRALDPALGESPEVPARDESVIDVVVVGSERPTLQTLVIDAREAELLEQLVYGRLVTAEGNAERPDGIPESYQESERRDIAWTRNLLERVRFVQRQFTEDV